MKKRIFMMLLSITLLVSACAGEGANVEQSVASGSDVVETEEIEIERSADETEQALVEGAQDVTDADVIPAENESLSVAEIFAEWENTYNKLLVEDITEALDREGIRYTGYYNKSGERLDMTLEDGTSLLFLKTKDPDMNDAGYELIMKDEVINVGGFQENYLNCYDVIRDDYYFPELSEQLLDENFLWDYNQTNLSIMRNEIYAKYGRKFEDLFLNAVFSLKTWYEPRYTAQEFNAVEQELLTNVDKQNLQTIIQYETNRGYRKKGGDPSESAQELLSGSWIDLDGNGTKEKVCYEKIKSGEYGEIYLATLKIFQEDESGIVTDNDMRLILEGDNLHDNFYILTMDDQHDYLAIGDYGPSADNSMIIYEYNSGKLEEVGQIYDDPNYIKIYPDKIEASERSDHIHSQFVTFTYVLQNGKFVKKQQEYYEYGQKVVTVKQECALYEEKDSNGTQIPLAVGDEIKILGGDQNEWVLFQKVSTGEEGWLYVEKPGKCRLLDGSMVWSEQVLEGLDFFG